MINSMSITIITVVKNDLTGIQKTFESVIGQSSHPEEFIIIDGKSTDGTSEWIENKKKELKSEESGKSLIPFDGILKYISENDTSVYDAMNKGLKIANSDYVCFVNSGDHLEPNACEIIKNEFNSNTTSYDLYYGCAKIFSKQNQLLKIMGGTLSNLSNEMIMHPTCFMSISALRALNGFNTKYKSAADLDLIFRFKSKNFSSKFIEKVLSNFYLGGISGSKNGHLETLKIKFKYQAISGSTYWFRSILMWIK